MPTIRWVARWVVVFGAATFGSWCGRIIAAFLYNEPVTPLLQVDARTLLSQDVAPGFLAAEMLGRGIGTGIAGEIVFAAAGAALSAVATGPLMGDGG